MGEAGGSVGAGLAPVTFRGGKAGGPLLTGTTGAGGGGGAWFRRKILSKAQSARNARAMPNGAVMSQAGLRMVYSVTPQRIATK